MGVRQIKCSLCMLGLALLTLGGCAKKNGEEKLLDKSAQTLYQNAEYMLEVDKDRKKAVELFAEV